MSTAEALTARWRSVPAAPAVAVGLVFVLIAAALLKSGSGTITGQAVLTGLVNGGVYSLLAMGLTLIFGVLDIVNFAHGAFLAVALFTTYQFVATTGANPYVALPIAIAALFALGALAQWALLNHTMGRPLESQLLLTLGLSLLVSNLLLLAFGGDPLSVAVAGDHGINVLGAVANQTRLVAFGGALVLAAGLYLLLGRTRLGRAIRAVAASRQGAGLVGIDVRKIYVLTFGLGTACAGAAGMLIAPFTTITPTAGDQFNILAFVVVVMGGLGNVAGALISGIIVGLVEQLGGVLLTGQSPLFGVFLVFILILVARPQGLFGARQ
ncbi:branched-chain amino acid ABC transporter permease [Cryptosporangium arvum]|jgi:branched-chain amino acid transport system permease protein|uniref:Amino acid/amide ABC transporter membrane protein 1, HAAT family n=1 Tax=Cryptosporangium arvum DSM 44712 TaxID=927661 RepID=A0A011AHX7_9ACTN|nr:branched-chain amino acid ABC transporter permease [Cryptosporangium arvum]EXG81616.1 amino acid/amide ABC transporter membrane protein 1, HAAT family [Cryptosporangium arvum DSM 44712]